MPRVAIIGWTLIGCGVAARIFLPILAPPNDRVHGAQYACYVLVFFAGGLMLVGSPILRRYFGGHERTDRDVNRERWGCGLLLIGGIVLYVFGVTLFEPP